MFDTYNISMLIYTNIRMDIHGIVCIQRNSKMFAEQFQSNFVGSHRIHITCTYNVEKISYG